MVIYFMKHKEFLVVMLLVLIFTIGNQSLGTVIIFNTSQEIENEKNLIYYENVTRGIKIKLIMPSYIYGKKPFKAHLTVINTRPYPKLVKFVIFLKVRDVIGYRIDRLILSGPAGWRAAILIPNKEVNFSILCDVPAWLKRLRVEGEALLGVIPFPATRFGFIRPWYLLTQFPLRVSLPTTEDPRFFRKYFQKIGEFKIFPKYGNIFYVEINEMKIVTSNGLKAGENITVKVNISNESPHDYNIMIVINLLPQTAAGLEGVRIKIPIGVKKTFIKGYETREENISCKIPQLEAGFYDLQATLYILVGGFEIPVWSVLRERVFIEGKIAPQWETIEEAIKKLSIPIYIIGVVLIVIVIGFVISYTYKGKSSQKKAT